LVPGSQNGSGAQTIFDNPSLLNVSSICDFDIQHIICFLFSRGNFLDRKPVGKYPFDTQMQVPSQAPKDLNLLQVELVEPHFSSIGCSTL
jgi:hypothetical protein